MNLVFDGDKYNRDYQDEILINKFKKFYDINFVLFTPSGLAAISIILNTFLHNNKNKIRCCLLSELYKETVDLFKYFIEYLEIEYTDEDLNISEDIDILFLESCSNPTNKLPKLEKILDLKKKNPNLFVIIDNTWLTHEILNPFNYYADVVILSLTKYYSGGKSIAGCLLFKDIKYYELCKKWIKINGIHTSPYNIKVINENIDTMKERMEKASNNTIEIIYRLRNIRESKLKKIIHISDKIVWKIYPSVFCLIIDKERIEIKNIFNSMKYITKNGTYGDKHTNYCPFIIKKCEEGYLTRFSVGYDIEIEKVMTDLLLLIKN